MLKQRFSLKRKLILLVLSTSTVITALVFGLTMYYDYRVETSHQDLVANNILKTAAPSLALSLWNFNETQTQSTLKGILSLSEISGVKLRLVDSQDTQKIEKEILIEDTPLQSAEGWQSIPIYYSDAGKNQLLAYLDLQLNHAEIIAKLKSKFSVYLILQTTKTLLLSFILLWLFQAVATSRIEKVISFLESADLSSLHTRKTLRLDYNMASSDELNKLSRAINRLTYKVSKYNVLSSQKLSETETQLRNQEAKAVHSSKMAALGEMAAGIAHEINNPLAIIQSNAELLKIYSAQDQLDKEKLGKSLDRITNTTNRIARIIKGLRNFTRDANADPFENCSLESVISETLDFCSAKLNNSEIRLKYEPTSNIQFEGRPAQISQVLLNLISNSADAIKDLPIKWISIEVKAYEQYFCVTITDSGPGIPSAIAEKIMQPFFTTKEVDKGTGLGLSISKSLVEQHRGQLDLNAKSPHTQFIIRIPIVQNQTGRLAT